MANVVLGEKRSDKREWSAYWLRHIFRWYSKTFSTPLHVVESLPLDHVLTAYYEERYESMNEQELEEAKALLLETPEERKQREADEAAREAEEEIEAQRIEAEEQERLSRIAAKRSKQKLVEGEDLKPGQLILETVGGNQRVVAEIQQGREVDLPVAETEEPVIKMEFVDDATFEARLEGLGTMDEPKK
jgi:hypothetical protein